MSGNITINEWANRSDMELEKNTSPVTTFDYVRLIDVDGANYVSGSEGQVREVIEYRDYAKLYVVTTTTFKYEYADLPTKVSTVEVR